MQIAKQYHIDKGLDLMSINSFKDAKSHFQLALNKPGRADMTNTEIQAKIRECDKKKGKMGFVQ